MIISKSSKLNLLFKAYGRIVYQNFLKQSSKFSADQIKAFEDKMVLKALIEADNSPYYHSLFSDIRFNPKYDFTTIADLSKIPILSKDDIKKNYQHIINPKYKGIAVEYKTSGSTGEPLKMLLTPYMVAMDKAMIYRHHSFASQKLRPTIFSLRSYVKDSADSPLFKYDLLQNSYYFSAYDLNSSNADFYIQKLIEINPDILRGYPSSIAFLCDFLKSSDVKRLTNLKKIYTSSETLSETEREKIEKLFGNRILNWYGMTEPAVIIMEEGQGNGMRVCWEYGYSEFLSTNEPQVKKLVTTSYYNHVMPFIRYETQDLVTVTDDFDRQLSNKSYHFVNNVIGRKDDYIIGSKNALLPSINFYTLFREITKIKSFQIIQYSTLEVLVLIEVAESLKNTENISLLNGLKNRIGYDIPIYIKETTKFITNKDGKRQVVVKKQGSYKLSAYNEYSLSTQKAWQNYRDHKKSYKLDWNEADNTPNPMLLSVLQSLFADDNYVKWYPETNHINLLNKLQQYTKTESIDNLLVTHGSDSAIRLILQVYTSNSKCISLFPNYDNFRAQAECVGNEVVNFTIHEPGDNTIRELIEFICSSNARLVYLTTPNNPIGYEFSLKQIEDLANVCLKFNAILIVDEAYYEFSGNSCVELIKKVQNLIIIRTFSKAFGMAGLRLGYIISSKEIIDNIKPVVNPKDVTMLAVKAGEYMLDNIDSVKKYAALVNHNKNEFYKYADENQIEYYQSAANFISFKVDDVIKYLKFMEDNGIYLRDRRSYFNDSYVRITVGSEESFTKFLDTDKEYRKLNLKT